MAEAAGQIFEGMGRPEVVKPRVVDKVRERVVNRLKQNTGQIVEQKWMDAYQKTVDALDDGMRKNLAKKLRIVAVGVSKTARVGSAVGDFAMRLGGLLEVVRGAHAIVRPQYVIDRAKFGADAIMNNPLFDNVPQSVMNRTVNKLDKFANMTPKQMRIQGGLGVGVGLIEGALGKARISRVAAGWLADVSGTYGEKVAQITNKILKGKPRPVATAG